MLESYISPFLLGYVDKYIKNLKPEDLQLSLWGGDLVLNKLDLRLDVLERDLNLPLTFVSGHVHELRIHVPWTRLGSEPVIVTINTIECALKLRDAAADSCDDQGSASGKSTSTTASESTAGAARLKYEKQDGDLPPGYVQSLMNRIANNAKLVIKNLVLKYVEDDIVLSVNVKSAESYAVNANWDPVFTELSLPELVLRRLCDLSDLTVCLDRRDASGKIELYQEPVAFRCALRLRVHMTYPNINAKKPSIVKLSVYCNEVNMSLSDTQLPMFIRLVTLMGELYYGTLDTGSVPMESEDGTKDVEAVKADAKTEPYTTIEPLPQGDAQGWASWAWSYIPEILSYDEDDDWTAEVGGGPRHRRGKRLEPVLSIGMYCNVAQLTFKLTKEVPKTHPVYSKTSLVLQTFPLLKMELSGSAIEILMHGEEFFAQQMGFSHVTISVVGDCVCDLPGGHADETISKEPYFLQCGNPDYVSRRTNYLTHSLFDENCAENKQQRAAFILDWDDHRATYSEALATRRFGATWMDYLYVTEQVNHRNVGDSSSRSSHHSGEDTDGIFTLKETSYRKVLINPAKLVISSAVVHRLQKVVECAASHEYEPYSTPKPEIVDPKRAPATASQVAVLEEWVPTRSSHLTLLSLQVLVMSADHPYYRPRKAARSTQMTVFQEVRCIPTLSLQMDRIDVQTTEPMYIRRLVKPVSRLAQKDRSSKLMHHCYSHRHYEVFGCQFGLTFIDPYNDLSPPVLPIVPSWSAAVFHRDLVLPVYWEDMNVPHTEVMLQLPSVSCSATKAQCLLIQHVHDSWTSRRPEEVVARLAASSLTDDVFRPSVEAFPSGQPVLQASVDSLELKITRTSTVQAMSGTLNQAQVSMQSLNLGRVIDTPLFHGPLDTSELHHRQWFTKQSQGTFKTDDIDLITFTLQLPLGCEIEETMSDPVGVLLLDVRGTSLCIEPVIYTWLLYQPRGQGQPRGGGQPRGQPRGQPESKSQDEPSRREKEGPDKRKQSSQDGVHQSKATRRDQAKPGPPLQRQTSSLQHTAGGSSTQTGRTDQQEGRADAWSEILEKIWPVVKQLTIQVDIQSCFVALPTNRLTFDTNVAGIPQYIIQRMQIDNGQSEMVLVSLPTVRMCSLNHQQILALQKIPVSRRNLPPDTGEKLPWNVKATNFSIYTIHSQSEGPHYLLKPLGLSTTVGVTSSQSGHGASLGLCIHADMQEVHMACSKVQVSLMFKLLSQAISNQSKLARVFFMSGHQAASPSNAKPSSPAKSAPRPLSSVASSTGPPADNQETSTFSVSSPADLPVGGERTVDSDVVDDGHPPLRLSLWLQWTLQKCCLSLYGVTAPPRGALPTATKLTWEVEDLTTSLDFQEVYSKVTCKVGSLNVHHYRMTDKSWSRGPFCGILFSSNDTITRSTPLCGLPPTSKQPATSRPFNPFSSAVQPAKLSTSKSHGFLTTTWTSALAQSVARKIPAQSGVPPPPSLKVGRAEKERSTSRHYINEIVVSVQAFDVILWCPAVVTVVDIFQVGDERGEGGIVDSSPVDAGVSLAARQRPKLPRNASATTSFRSPSDSYPSFKSASPPLPSPQEWLSTRGLPLAYVDCKEVRVFAPAPPGAGGDGEVASKQDTFVLQVNSVCLRPHADNPLQRLVLKKDLFRSAVQAGQTQTPGSAIEDRQYQLDVNNMSLSVAVWDQIEACSGKGTAGNSAEMSGVSLVQNPALEWNMEQLGPSPKEACLLPIVVGIDMRVVAAPAVVIDKSRGGSEKHKPVSTTVCGHSIEVDFTSDMTLYLSTGQVCLLQELLEKNFKSLATLSKPQQQQKHQQQQMPGTTPSGIPAKHAEQLDSGLGSEESIPAGVRGQRLKVVKQEKVTAMPTPTPVQKSRKSAKRGGFTPIDALATAGRVAIFLYSHDSRAEKPAPHGKLPTINESTSMMLRPFLFVTVVQPAAILFLGHEEQRSELTVYDLTVDGAPLKSDNEGASSEDRLLPNPSDYTMPWFETCPGEPKSTTGVRPALVTFTIMDCLSNQASAKLQIGRPAKVCLSLSKVDQALEMADRLVQTRPSHTATAANWDEGRNVTPQGGAILIPVLPHAPPIAPPGSATRSSGQSDALDIIFRIESISLEMREFVVTVATVANGDYPHIVCSFAGCSGDVRLLNSTEIQAHLALEQLQLKTSICRKTRSLIGPFNLNATVNGQWAVSLGKYRSMKRASARVNVGHVTASLGQENLNCLVAMQRHFADYAVKNQNKKPIVRSRTVASKQAVCSVPIGVISQQPDRHYKDELRAGTFRYVTDNEGIELYPKANEIVFFSPIQDGSVKGHWGSMTWHYPEPRALTYVSITPIPLHQPEQAGLKDASGGVEVPCTLEYWDDLRQDFVVHRQLYVSEMHSYHVRLPTLTGDQSSKQALSMLWRVVLNTVAPDGEDEPLVYQEHPGLIISPTALAASMRVDSCYSAQLIPKMSLGLSVDCVDVRLAHHTDTLGKVVSPKWLEPYTLDSMSPSDLEFMVLHLDTTMAYVRHWPSLPANTCAQLSTSPRCDLTTYRNLTMTTLLHPTPLDVALDVAWGRNAECRVDLPSVKVSVGQETVHSLNMAVQAVAQANSADCDRLLFCTYVICNDTDEPLRFGQVHTDESVVLASGRAHEYSWRSHKQHRQKLHVCIEGWRNWRWSEPFSLDKEGTLVRLLHRKEHTTTMFIKIKNISALQKQIIFEGQHIFHNDLGLDLEIQLVRLAPVGSEVVDTRRYQSLSVGSGRLPSLTCSSSDITGVRVKLRDEGCDWSEQFAVSGDMSRERSILKVADRDGVCSYMWCHIFAEEHGEHVQRMVLFSPLFVVCSHLPWPTLMNIRVAKLDDTKVVEVKGRGIEQSMYECGPANWHNITFQLGPNASPSSPSVAVNTSMLSQLRVDPTSSSSKCDRDDPPITIEAIGLQRRRRDLAKTWPYNNVDHDCTSTINGASCTAEAPSTTYLNDPDDPDRRPGTDLLVSVTRISHHLGTIRLDVLPWCLIVNETKLDLVVSEPDGQTLTVSQGEMAAPPRFEESFCLQLAKSNYTTSGKSNPIHLVQGEPSRVTPGHTGDLSTLTLGSEEHIHVCLPVLRMGLPQNRVVRLTVRSTFKHHMRIITILSQFVVRNQSKNELMLRTMAVMTANKPVSYGASLQNISVPSASPEGTCLPITQWNIPLSGDGPITTWESVQFVSLAHGSSLATSKQTVPAQPIIHEQTHWCGWVLVDVSRPRLPVAVPINHIYSRVSPKPSSTSETVATQPYIVLVAEQRGVTYLTLADDPIPRVTVANACSYPLNFGQTPFNSATETPDQVLEQTGLVSSLPIVLPHCLVHYDFARPTTGTTSDGNQQSFTPSIHLCLGSFPSLAISLDNLPGQSQDKDERKAIWTSSIKMATDHRKQSEILSVAGAGYVLVSSHCVGTQLQIRIDPLSKGFSKSAGGSPTGETSARAVNSLLAIGSEISTSRVSVSAPIQPEYRLRVSAGSVVVMLMDEITDLGQTAEIVRLTLDGCHLLSFPLADEDCYSSATAFIQRQQIRASVWACQLDNQSFDNSRDFDFPVVLCNQRDASKSSAEDPPGDASFEKRAAFYSLNHSLNLMVHVERCGAGAFSIASAELQAEPLELYIDDQLLHEILVQLRTFVVPAVKPGRGDGRPRRGFPAGIDLACAALVQPISLRRFTIGPVVLLASVHASLKLFVAIDSTPLSFGQFDSGPMFATVRQLVQALTVHYTSGALFKAGWALGSLEILGNPAGLLRNVRSGLADSVLLPYEGLTRGPVAFVAGVTSGTSSLLRHLSAGTLTSITKFASSVSRNLDQLTLDEDHIARRQQQRRHRVPDRVTDGLIQGLSGFGLSLLGAIAGIADQPIKSLCRAPTVSSPTQKARGVVRGVGKGLVGVVIKPLGGVAEFVSQAGQGVLHSAGLVETRTPRGDRVTSLSAAAANSRLKYTWKMLGSLPNAEILFSCDAATFTPSGLQRAGTLLLTAEVLFVVSLDEDNQQQAFPVVEVECGPVAGSDAGVGVRVRGPVLPSVLKKKETSSRVADFVGAVSPYHPPIVQVASSDSQSEGSSMLGGGRDDGTGVATYEFFLQRAPYRATFLALFGQAKNRLYGKGFCYDETNHTAGFSQFKTWHSDAKLGNL